MRTSSVCNGWMRSKFEILAVTAVAAYFLYLSGAGQVGGLSHDDLMNMDRAWSSGPWKLFGEILLFFQYSPNYRPFGGLFYALCFDAFDFHHAAFRAVTLVFLLANLVVPTSRSGP